MVRPDEANRSEFFRAEVSRFVDPAGASPVQSDTGNTGSRLQQFEEIRAATAECHRPWQQLERFAGEQARGRQHEVKPAASTEKQWESRAAHFTAKATSTEPCSGVSLVGPSGVWGAARAHGLVRNRRDPSFPPTSGKDRPYKPMVKSSGGKRESDGVVVATYTIGAKGPDFGHAGDEGTCQGMAGHLSWSIHPGGLSSVEIGA